MNRTSTEFLSSQWDWPLLMCVSDLLVNSSSISFLSLHFLHSLFPTETFLVYFQINNLQSKSSLGVSIWGNQPEISTAFIHCTLYSLLHKLEPLISRLSWDTKGHTCLQTWPYNKLHTGLETASLWEIQSCVSSVRVHSGSVLHSPVLLNMGQLVSITRVPWVSILYTCSLDQADTLVY